VYHHIFGLAKDFFIWMLEDNPLDVAEEHGFSLVFRRKRRVRMVGLLGGLVSLSLALYFLKEGSRDWPQFENFVYFLFFLPPGALGFLFASGEIVFEPDCFRKTLPGRSREIPWREITDIYDAIDGKGLAVVGKNMTIQVNRTYSTPPRFYAEIYARSGVSRNKPFSPGKIFVSS
jgi:hypothetical protein